MEFEQYVVECNKISAVLRAEMEAANSEQEIFDRYHDQHVALNKFFDAHWDLEMQMPQWFIGLTPLEQREVLAEKGLTLIF